MDAKNFMYLCIGFVLGTLGTLGFLYIYQEPEYEPIQETPQETDSLPPHGVDGKSSIDNFAKEEAPKQVDYYACIADTYKHGESKTDAPSGPSIEPKLISEEQFLDACLEGQYDIHSLTLYGDLVLADDTTDEVMDETDIFSALGPNYPPKKLLELFARGHNYGNDDPIHIRNDRLYTLYEIAYDTRSYKEVTLLV